MTRTFVALLLSAALSGVAAYTSLPGTGLPAPETPNGTESTAVNSDAAFDFGLALSVKDITSEGLTVVFHQSGYEPKGDLITGSWFSLEKYENGVWQDVLRLTDSLMWTSEAYIITPGGTTEHKESWQALYGSLDKGRYRISKEILEVKSPGNYTSSIVYAGFEIE